MAKNSHAPKSAEESELVAAVSAALRALERQAPREPGVQLSEPLLDCLIHAAYDLPLEWRIGLANAEKRVGQLRARVPELRGYDDVEVSRLKVEAWRASLAALDPNFA